MTSLKIKIPKKRKIAVPLDAESPPLKKPCKTAIPKQSYKSNTSSIKQSVKSKKSNTTASLKQGYKRKPAL